MYVSEVAALFLQYVDERDPTFFDDPTKQTWLKMGYDMFRQLVKVDDEKVYLRDVSLVFANASDYDLAAAGGHVLADVVGADGQLAMAAVHHDRELDGRRPPVAYPVGPQSSS